MKYEKPRNPAWPDWYDGKKINEVRFCYDFLKFHPLKCIDGQFYTPDGPVENEAEIKQKVLLEIESYVTSGLSKKVSSILDSLRLLAYAAPMEIEADRIHLQNGVYHLADGTFQENKMFCRNRLPVAYNAQAAAPERWLTFLGDLLDAEDIPHPAGVLGLLSHPQHQRSADDAHHRQGRGGQVSHWPGSQKVDGRRCQQRQYPEN